MQGDRLPVHKSSISVATADFLPQVPVPADGQGRAADAVKWPPRKPKVAAGFSQAPCDWADWPMRCDAQSRLCCTSRQTNLSCSLRSCRQQTWQAGTTDILQAQAQPSPTRQDRTFLQPPTARQQNTWGLSAKEKRGSLLHPAISGGHLEV